MKWEGRRGSDNVEDRRGVSTGRVVGGGGLGLVAMALIVWALGGDPMAVLQGGMSGGQIQSGGGQITEADQRERFLAIAPLSEEGLYLVPRVIE